MKAFSRITGLAAIAILASGSLIAAPVSHTERFVRDFPMEVGGSLWIETDEGWAIAGVNDWGDDVVYGSTGGFGRVSPQYEWIKSIFDAKFTGE